MKTQKKYFLSATLVAAVCVVSSYSFGTTLSSAAVSTGTGERRAVIMVPMGKGASPQDFSFLAAVPAGTKANTHNPAVLAVDPYATIRPEMHDFLRRYKPTQIYLLDARSSGKRRKKGWWPTGPWMKARATNAPTWRVSIMAS